MLALLQKPMTVGEACGDSPGWACRNVFEATDNRFLAEAADAILGGLGRVVLIVIIAWLASRFLRRAIDRFTQKVIAGNNTRAASRAQTLSQVLRSVTNGVIWTIVVVTLLGELDVELGPLIASAGIAGVALGFGAQSLVKDFLTGFFILVEDQYGVGDFVDLEGPNGLASGTVEAVSLRTTRMRDVEGTVWHVPNGTIDRVRNHSQEWARCLLDVDVAYDTDMDLAQNIIKQTADGLFTDPDWRGVILEEPEVWGVQNLGGFSVSIRLVVKTRPAEQWRVTREMRGRLLKALADAQIEIPDSRERTVDR